MQLLIGNSTFFGQRHYIATAEPVGSKALVEEYNLGVSPAIRNAMGVLEKGLLYQPHTCRTGAPQILATGFMSTS